MTPEDSKEGQTLRRKGRYEKEQVLGNENIWEFIKASLPSADSPAKYGWF